MFFDDKTLKQIRSVHVLYISEIAIKNAIRLY